MSVWASEYCSKCGYLLDDNLKCPECEICNGGKMKDTITLTSGTTFHGKYDEHDVVNNPKHYNRGGLECIEAIEAMTEKMSGDIAPHAANVLKYLWRCEYKNGIQDIDKAIWYLNRLKTRWMQRDEVEKS